MPGSIRFAAVLFLTFIGVAAAADVPPSSAVHYHDLDLKQGADVAQLHGRLQKAARRVCAALDGLPLRERAEFNRCVIVAVGDAVGAIGSSGLTEYHLARSPRASARRLAANR